MKLTANPPKIGPNAAPSPDSMLKIDKKIPLFSRGDILNKRLLILRLIPAQKLPPMRCRKIGNTEAPGITVAQARGRKTATQAANRMITLFLTLSEIRPQTCIPTKSAHAETVFKKATNP